MTSLNSRSEAVRKSEGKNLSDSPDQGTHDKPDLWARINHYKFLWCNEPPAEECFGPAWIFCPMWSKVSSKKRKTVLMRSEGQAMFSEKLPPTVYKGSEVLGMLGNGRTGRRKPWWMPISDCLDDSLQHRHAFMRRWPGKHRSWSRCRVLSPSQRQCHTAVRCGTLHMKAANDDCRLTQKPFKLPCAAARVPQSDQSIREAVHHGKFKRVSSQNYLQDR